ncbi:MAG: RNA-binding transcriptional accessory protein, partial [Caldisericia bacterium]|nr:RNA-binding transcriptional accessory protein [Caldisericia bacterium]
MNPDEKLFLEKEISHLTCLLSLSSERIEKALLLKNDGCTLPFIARYRKEATRGLDEEELRSIFSSHDSWIKLQERKEAIIELLESKKVLSKTLLKIINSTKTSAELESLY